MTLRRWWSDLFRARNRAPALQPADDAPGTAAGGATDDPPDDLVRRAPAPRRYTPPARPPEDPQREAHLGAVLQVLAAGPLDRAELGRRVGAGAWGAGRLDAVVDHGVATGVLITAEGSDGGTVRARYAD